MERNQLERTVPSTQGEPAPTVRSTPATPASPATKTITAPPTTTKTITR